MRTRPSWPVQRKTVGVLTNIFLYAVNHNCTSAVMDWPDNNDRITFIPSDDDWVMPLFRENIEPDYHGSGAENAGQASVSVYAEMAKQAKAIFDYQLFVGYQFIELKDQQLSLF